MPGNLLDRVFEPSVTPCAPVELDRIVRYSYPYLEPSLRYFDSSRASVTSAANGATALGGPVVPAGRYQYVFAAELSHNDPIARTIQLQYGVPVTGEVVTFAQGTGAALATLEFTVPMARAIILGPGAFLRGLADAMGVGSRQRISYAFLELNLGEPCPQM